MKNPSYYQRYTPTGLSDADPVTLSTQLILDAALELGIEVHILPGTKIIQLRHNGVVKYFRFQISTETTDIGFYACLDKSVTNNLLRSQGVQVPSGFHITRTDSQEYWQEIFLALEKPLVVKPTHGNQGNAISIGISDQESYRHAIQKALDFNNDKDAGVIVEQLCQGQEYRILTTREKVLGVLYRMPANVVGDGEHTIQELLDSKNADPRRGDDLTFALFTIKIDDEVHKTLEEQHLTLDSVPAENERVFLRKVSNIAKGGDSIDVTDTTHQSVKDIALKAINAIPGLDFAGVDLMTTNIEREQTPDTHTIIEINSSPGFCIQEFPFLGNPRKAQYEFLYLAFPHLRP